MKTLLLLVYSLISTLSVSVAQDNSRVSVEISGAQLSRRTLTFHWRIENRSNTTIYVYSAFLNGPAVGHHIGDGGEVEIDTSLTHKLDVDIYGYPQAKFVKLEPGVSREGEFTDHRSGGAWTRRGTSIMFHVSYGTDLGSIETSLQRQFTSPKGGHPANPLVDWQKIATSNPLAIR